MRNFPELFWSDSGWVEKNKSSTFSNIQKINFTLPDNGMWLEHQVSLDSIFDETKPSINKESPLDQRKYDREGYTEVWNDDYNKSYYGD